MRAWAGWISGGASSVAPLAGESLVASSGSFVLFGFDSLLLLLLLLSFSSLSLSSFSSSSLSGRISPFRVRVNL